MLWGEEEEAEELIFKFVPVGFVDYDNEIRTGSDSIRGQPETTNAQTTFEVVEINDPMVLPSLGARSGMTNLLVRDEYKLVKAKTRAA